MGPVAQVDLVVPTVGRPSLAALLEALAGPAGPPERSAPAVLLGEVLLVDDRPRAEGPLLPAGPPSALAGRVRMLRGRAAGPAAARNTGWRAARAPWVAFLDDDVVPTPTWLAALAADLAAADASPRVAGSQGRVRVPLPAGRRPTDWERNVAGLERARWATADLAYRRGVLAEVGGFDERFGRAYREDADLGLRVTRAGYRIVRGRRMVLHPARPAGAWVSVRLQAGNADDALMAALHGRGWREAAGAPPGRRRRHLAVTAAGTLGLAGLGLTRTGPAAPAGRLLAATGLAGWLAGTAELAWARIAPGPRTPAEVSRMLATSTALPAAATWHWLRGLATRGRLLADTTRAPHAGAGHAALAGDHTTAGGAVRSHQAASSTNGNATNCFDTGTETGIDANTHARGAHALQRRGRDHGGDRRRRRRDRQGDAAAAAGRGAEVALAGIAPGSRTPAKVARRMATSTLLPVAASWHRLRGLTAHAEPGGPTGPAASGGGAEVEVDRGRVARPRKGRGGRAHVLVARQDSMGDVLLAGPAVRAVAAGAGRVTLLCGPRGRAAAELLPGVDQVLCRTAPWIDPDRVPVRREDMEELVGQVAALGVDQAVILTSFHQSALPLALLLRMAGVGEIAAVSEDYPGSLLDVRHHVPDDIHEVQRALSTVATLGYRLPPGDDGSLAVRLDPEAVQVLPPRPYVVVHPGASVPARAWPPDRCAALVAELAAADVRVVVTGDQTEWDLTARVAGDAAPVLDLGGRLSLSELAAVLAGADAVVVGNTGPAHLAAAVGTPVVSLFAPVVPAQRWRPWRVPHVLLGDQTAPCAGTRARVCPVPGHPCLGDVGVGEVLAALERLGTPVAGGEEARS